MPELPEVETTRLGITPFILGHRIDELLIRNPSLRWPIPNDLPLKIHGQHIRDVRRRGKYILFDLEQLTLLLHLGMSGSLRICSATEPFRKHDHWLMRFDQGQQLRFHDPRRFGALLYTHESVQSHPLLHHLGPEPLEPEFTGAYLYKSSRGKTAAVKNFIMDSSIVVGVGNIYAAESLFRSGIRPTTAAGRISSGRYDRLAENIRSILTYAIQRGGTTLRDFTNSQGEPGYFQLELDVYGRSGQPCRLCAQPLKTIKLGQRTSVFCPKCQR